MGPAAGLDATDPAAHRTAAAFTRDYPKRWHIEEFFNFDQSLGWKRAGTMNIKIRYGQKAMALPAKLKDNTPRKKADGSPKSKPTSPPSPSPGLG